MTKLSKVVNPTHTLKSNERVGLLD